MIPRTEINVRFIIASGGHRLAADELQGEALFVPKPFRMEAIPVMVGEGTRRSRAFPNSLAPELTFAVTSAAGKGS